MQHYVIDIIYETVKLTRLKKEQIIQKTNNLIFQVIFVFFDWSLIKQIIVFSTPFCRWGKEIFKKLCLQFLIGNGDMSKNV